MIILTLNELLIIFVHNVNIMKVGKLPVASIILVVITLTSLLLKLFYPAQVVVNSAFINGAFAGSLFVLGLYYVNIYYTAWTNNRKEAKAHQE